MPDAYLIRRNVAAAAAMAGATVVGTFAAAYDWGAFPFPMDTSVERIGHMLVGTGAGSLVLPFELVSVLLLAAMIGCIVIAMKSRHEEK